MLMKNEKRQKKLKDEFKKRVVEFSSLAEEVYVQVKAIPSGRVSTYGAIAKELGRPKTARLIGRILHLNPKPREIPCYRVVNCRGFLAANFTFGGLAGQQRRLEAEGVVVKNKQVDLEKFGFLV